MAAALFGIFPLDLLVDDDNVGLAGGKLYTYEAGTSTPLATYTDPDLAPEHAHENPIILNAAGRPSAGASPSAIYVLPQGYKFVLTDADDVEIVTLDDWSDPGYIYAERYGYEQAQGAQDQTSGYQVLTTDRLVTMDSTGGPDPCLVNLPAANEYFAMLIIKNMGTIELSIVPDGSDTIETIAAAVTLPAASSPVFPAVQFLSDGVSNWIVVGSHAGGV